MRKETVSTSESISAAPTNWIRNNNYDTGSQAHLNHLETSTIEKPPQPTTTSDLNRLPEDARDRDIGVD